MRLLRCCEEENGALLKECGKQLVKGKVGKVVPCYVKSTGRDKIVSLEVAEVSLVKDINIVA